MGLLNWFSQVASITKFGILSIPQRVGSVAAALFGIAGVVGVLVGVLSIAAGFSRVMQKTGSPDSVIILRSGANSEMVSGLSRDEIRLIEDAPGLARNAAGPLASAELFVVINLPKRTTGTDANVPMRGVGRQGSAVRENFKLLSGRMFEPGKNEVIVGEGALREFVGTDLGNTIKLGSNQWTVAGIFTTGGSSADSELWTDSATLQSAYKRGDSFQSACAKLTSAGAFREFKDALTSNPQLNVKVQRQSEYFAEQSKMMTQLINTLGYLVASLMAVGAIFGALNTMYNSVSTRTREIATLRALGFGRGAILTAVLLESMVLALVGGAVGATIAYLLFNGFHTTTMNWESFSQVTFAFAVTPQLLLQGIVLAGLVGLIGGAFPAIRAARMPIAGALREL